MQMSKWETKEPLEAEIPRVRMNSKNPTRREKQEHEDSGHAVYRSWCAACVEGRGVGEHRIEPLEEGGKRKDDSDRSFRLRFSDTGKRRHVSNSDLSETAGTVKRERHVVNGKVPQHTAFHFLSVSSEILVFAESF